MLSLEVAATFSVCRMTYSGTTMVNQLGAGMLSYTVSSMKRTRIHLGLFTNTTHHVLCAERNAVPH